MMGGAVLAVRWRSDLSPSTLSREPTASFPDGLAAPEFVARHVRDGRSLIDIFHAIQDELGYVPQQTIAPLSRALNLSRAEVHGVLTYYHHFRTTPPPATVIRLCRAEACRSMGTEQLAAHIENRTGCRFDDASSHAASSASGPVGLESVYCFGQCALSPAMMINDRLYAKVTPQKFDALLAEHTAAAAAAVSARPITPPVNGGSGEAA